RVDDRAGRVAGACEVRAALLFTAALLMPALVSAQSETIEYYGQDAVGSVRIVFDAGGTVLGRQDYAPFGRILLPSFGMPAEGFVGNTTDGESDQGDFHARQYQTRTGKFGKVDPMYVDLFEPQAWNRYSYALNNPIRLTDVNGLYVQCIEQVISVVILGGGPQPAVIGGYAWHNKSCIDYGESNPDSSVTTPPSGPDPSPGTGTGSTGT